MMAAYVLFVFSLNITALYAPNSETSDRYYTNVTPPGWAFSIWGLIVDAEALALIAALIPATAASTRRSLVVSASRAAMRRRA
jgi:hypothetical protein